VLHLKLCGLCCSWDNICAKAPVRKEDMTRFCVAVVSNKVNRVQHNTVTPMQDASGTHPAPEQASAVAVPSLQNPLHCLPSHLLP
jgi:hypothetical protein